MFSPSWWAKDESREMELKPLTFLFRDVQPARWNSQKTGWKWQEMNIWRSFPARGKELSIAWLGQHGSRHCVSRPENLRVYAVLREELAPPTPQIAPLPISLSCLPLSEWRVVLVFSIYKIKRLNTYLAQHPGFSKCSKQFFPLPSRNQDKIKHYWILCRPKWQKETTPGFSPVESVDPLAT